MQNAFIKADRTGDAATHRSGRGRLYPQRGSGRERRGRRRAILAEDERWWQRLILGKSECGAWRVIDTERESGRGTDVIDRGALWELASAAKAISGAFCLMRAACFSFLTEE